MSSALPLRRSPRLAAKARAKFVAARLAYEAPRAIDNADVYWDESRKAIHFQDAIIIAYEDARAAYKKMVGNDKLHICRNIANQSIYEALLLRAPTNLLAYERAARVIRTLRYSLFEDDELIWDGDIFERIGNREIVEFIDAFIRN